MTQKEFDRLLWSVLRDLRNLAQDNFKKPDWYNNVMAELELRNKKPPEVVPLGVDKGKTKLG